MTITGLWRHGDWRHVATGCTALVKKKSLSIMLTATVKKNRMSLKDVTQRDIGMGDVMTVMAGNSRPIA